jgi:hypothetical protein
MRILGDKSIEKDASRLAVILSGQPGLQVYFPVTPTNLWDSGVTNYWSGGFSAAVGTYTFKPEDNSDLWPSNARGAIIMFGGSWAAAANTSTMSARISGGSTNEAQVRAYAASILVPTQGIVRLDGSGYFDIIVAGATASNSFCRMVGYFL